MLAVEQVVVVIDGFIAIVGAGLGYILGQRHERRKHDPPTGE